MNKIHKSQAAFGASLVVTSSFFYGLYGVWTKLMGSSFGIYQQAVFRSMLVVAIMLVIATTRKELSPLHWQRDARWFALSIISSGLISGPLYYATLRVGVGLAAALCYAGIILGMFLFGWIFSRERYTARKFIATGLAFVGLACIFAPSVHTLGLLALLAALEAGLATGLNVVASQKMPYSASQTTIIAWTGGILINIVLTYLTGEQHHHLTFDISWLYLVLFALTSIAASWSVIRGVKLIDAGSAGLLGLLEIVFGVVFGMLFFAERPSSLAFIGMVAIILAAAIPYLDHFKRRRTSITL
ncbi:MAG TPA: DMT family transporter [Candidatus Saccharimonadales bacterium]|nr:DMT family transporter [Candidatus Saccharimonadales bacterium]